MCCRSHSKQAEYGHETSRHMRSILLQSSAAADEGDNTMFTDYDAPRRTETDDVSEDSLEDLTARRSEARLAVVDFFELLKVISPLIQGRALVSNRLFKCYHVKCRSENSRFTWPNCPPVFAWRKTPIAC